MAVWCTTHGSLLLVMLFSGVFFISNQIRKLKKKKNVILDLLKREREDASLPMIT